MLPVCRVGCDGSWAGMLVFWDSRGGGCLRGKAVDKREESFVSIRVEVWLGTTGS